MNTSVIHKPLTDSEKVDRAIADAENERLAIQARETPCKYIDCTGNGHEFYAPVADWSHEAVNATFDGGIVKASISDCSGRFEGDIAFEGDGTMTADEFRTAATEYEAFPAWLRSMADRMDALTTEGAAL
ncbi:hypothetical protein [Cryobacterium tagatosivorans]|uniref:Uncharacterized protein n=1 Tax=Cryobacterium tagatosivorans TaxID=1259199 RepID=A0A4V3I6V8_9MICO|nr:hypothetical protein [Cryobacterium tagatosivorans]TFB46513.1 hypothetical protein E3O23_17150 [Cryobacterium tagatosivorans]